jgi:hypothetical protein
MAEMLHSIRIHRTTKSDSISLFLTEMTLSGRVYPVPNGPPVDWNAKQYVKSLRRAEYNEAEEVKQFAKKWVKHFFRKDNKLGYRVHLNKIRKILQRTLCECRKELKELDKNFKGVFRESMEFPEPLECMRNDWCRP